MTRLTRCAAALLFSAGAFLTADHDHASAAPIQPLVRADHGSLVMVNCKPGDPNCGPADSHAPTFCGGPGNPCMMDNAPDCQNANVCGIDPGDNNNKNNINGAGNMPGVVGAAKNPTGGPGPGRAPPPEVRK